MCEQCTGKIRTVCVHLCVHQANSTLSLHIIRTSSLYNRMGTGKGRRGKERRMAGWRLKWVGKREVGRRTHSGDQIICKPLNSCTQKNHVGNTIPGSTSSWKFLLGMIGENQHPQESFTQAHDRTATAQSLTPSPIPYLSPGPTYLRHVYLRCTVTIAASR